MAFAPHHDVFRALNAARIATRRGDVAQADRWMKIADRHLVMAQRLEKLRDYESARDFEEERRHYILGELVEMRESWAARNPKPETAPRASSDRIGTIRSEKDAIESRV